MFRNIQQKLGTAGFIISIVALVAALGGGAYAASGGLTGKQKKEVRNIAKTEAKKVAGAPGPAGPAGPKGDAGSNGSSGAAGAVGPAGTNGTNGTNGKNGTPGANGETGFTSTLPGGRTETGAWSFGFLPNVPLSTWRQAISFNIPLAKPIASTGCTTVVAGPPSHVATTCHVHYINVAGKEMVEPSQGTFEEMEQTVCTGSAAAPTAPPAELCVYEGKGQPFATKSASSRITALDNAETEGTSTAGATIRWQVEEESSASGTWAVTAEKE